MSLHTLAASHSAPSTRLRAGAGALPPPPRRAAARTHRVAAPAAAAAPSSFPSSSAPAPTCAVGMGALTVADVMTRNVLTVGPETAVDEGAWNGGQGNGALACVLREHQQSSVCGGGGGARMLRADGKREGRWRQNKDTSPPATARAGGDARAKHQKTDPCFSPLLPTALDLLVSKRITGLPVVDAAGKVVSLVCEGREESVC